MLLILVHLYVLLNRANITEPFSATCGQKSLGSLPKNRMTKRMGFLGFIKSDLKSAKPTVFGRRVPKNGTLSSSNSTVFRRCPKECALNEDCSYKFLGDLESDHVKQKEKEKLRNEYNVV